MSGIKCLTICVVLLAVVCIFSIATCKTALSADCSKMTINIVYNSKKYTSSGHKWCCRYCIFFNKYYGPHDISKICDIVRNTLNTKGHNLEPSDYTSNNKAYYYFEKSYCSIDSPDDGLCYFKQEK